MFVETELGLETSPVCWDRLLSGVYGNTCWALLRGRWGPRSVTLFSCLWSWEPHWLCTEHLTLVWFQRYLDEAEREKQQYMKELREYQQSEAYKMCTEKIQEKKIKKGQ